MLQTVLKVGSLRSSQKDVRKVLVIPIKSYNQISHVPSNQKQGYHIGKKNQSKEAPGSPQKIRKGR